MSTIAINNEVERLMLAMIEFEGWFSPDQTPNGLGSRSYRNHNPGNLRSSPFQAGTKEGYAFFKNTEIGRMAMQWDLIQKSRGNTATGLGPNSTLRDLIFTWAPPSDNNSTEQYLAFVIERSGLNETDTLGDIFKQ